MSDIRKAAEMALEALEGIHPGNITPMAEESWNSAMETLRTALAQPEQKPVAWVDARPDGYDFWGLREVPFGKHYLYIAPQSIGAAVLAEREACAQVLEGISNAPDMQAYAAAIRARSK